MQQEFRKETENMQYELKTNLQSVKLDHRKMGFNLKIMKKDREDQTKRVKVQHIFN